MFPNNPILGDTEEQCLKSTFAAINGKIKLQPKKSASILKINLNAMPSIVNDQDQMGMIENRLRLKQ